MKKFLLYDTDEGLNFDFSCIPDDKPWVSCRIFRVHDQDSVYFEVIKSEEFIIQDHVEEQSIGAFRSFQHAVDAAERIAHTCRAKNHWPMVNRTIH